MQLTHVSEIATPVQEATETITVLQPQHLLGEERSYISMGSLLTVLKCTYSLKSYTIVGTALTLTLCNVKHAEVKERIIQHLK